MARGIYDLKSSAVYYIIGRNSVCMFCFKFRISPTCGIRALFYSLPCFCLLHEINLCLVISCIRIWCVFTGYVCKYIIWQERTISGLVDAKEFCKIHVFVLFEFQFQFHFLNNCRKKNIHMHKFFTNLFVE